MTNENRMPTVSVVIVTYNRLVTLLPTLESFLTNTDYPRDRLELIVADDASSETVQAGIRAIHFDKYCFAEVHGGLGANQNRGLRAATSEYVLQLQDDWVCRGPADYLRRALDVLERHEDIGMIILNKNPNQLPVRNVCQVQGDRITVYQNEPDVPVRMVGQHAYTDWPHLKRKSFIEQLGPYKEGPNMWETELDFAQRINAQTRFFVADIAGTNVFQHIGAELSFNTGPWKTRLANRIEQIPGGSALLQLYRTARKCSA